MADNRDIVSKFFDPYGEQGGQSRATPEQLQNVQAMRNFAPQAQPVRDASFQPVAAMQPGAPQMSPAPQGGMYQQAAMQQQPQGMQESQIQTKLMNPEAQKAFQQQRAFEADAAKQYASAQADEARVQAAAYDKVGKEVQASMAEYQNTVDELRKSKVVDPQSKWGTEQKIGAALSMALGAFAASYGGGKNYAMDIIDGAIKRDLDLQEAQINKLGLNAKQSEGALNRAVQKFGDIGKARSAVEMAAIAQLEEKTKMLAAKSDNDKVKANANTMLAALSGKRAQIAQGMGETTITNLGKTGGGGGAAEIARVEKDQKEFVEFENARVAIMDAFEQGQKQGFAGAFPSMIGGKSEERKSSLGQVSGAIIGKIPGIKSDADFRNIVEPMLPKPTDPAATVEHKRNNLMKFIASQAPASWIKAQQGSRQTDSTKQQLGFR